MAKKSKAAAGYSLGKPHCGMCVHFTESAKGETGSCELVEGGIDEDMWCRLYKQKRKTVADEGYAK